MSLNRELAFQVADVVSKLEDSEEPGGFWMQRFAFTCGAPACLAGWTVSVATGKELVLPKPYRNLSLCFEEGATGQQMIRIVATEALRISHTMTDQLFLPKIKELTDDEDDSYYFADCDAEPDDPGFISAKWAAETMRHLARTGEVDWRASSRRVV